MSDPADPDQDVPLNQEPAIESDAESDSLFEGDIAGEGWSGDDIEAAYLKALSAVEDLPLEVEPTAVDGNKSNVLAEEFSPIPDVAAESAIVPSKSPGALEEVARVSPVPPAVQTAPTSIPKLAKGTDREPSREVSEDYSNVSSAQVIEAALFVGGTPLTARKIVGLLRGSFDTAFVEQAIDDLNMAYAAQARPYEIRHGEGGYRLELREEYDRLRHRVYGTGPREVRLAQDVLEVLALIAYRQPISQKEIESHGKQNAGNLIRQLLRRDLISFERGPGGRKDLLYQTTARFLSVFGISSLDDLPQAEDLAKK
jgi:segregation and condensation protein B